MGLQQKRGYTSLVIIFSLAMVAAIEAAQPPFACNSSNTSTKKLTFCSTELPIKQRAEDLVSRLTLDEKVSQLVNDAPAIPRLGIPAYQWWSESLHGVADAGLGVSFEGTIHAATSFPQVILTAASFDAHLWYRIGQAIGKEARAVYNQGQAQGMTFWAPNINILRDPRWGRGQETPGEDPLVTGRYGVSYVRGVQGDSFEGGGKLVNEGHLQASACCKHMTAYDLDRWDNITRYIFDAHERERERATERESQIQRERIMENSDQVVVFIDKLQSPSSQPTENPFGKFQSPRNQSTENPFKREDDPQHTNVRSQSAARMRSLRRPSFSKPKARAVEYNQPLLRRKTLIAESNESVEYAAAAAAILEEVKQSHRNASSSDVDDSSDGELNEDEEEEKSAPESKYRKKKRKMIKLRVTVEWMLFLTILTCLVCSLTISSVKKQLTWGMEVWKWCLMVMVTFSGRLVSGWVIRFLVFVIERNFMLRERVLYFVYGLRRSIQNCVWLGLVLLAWTCMFDAKVQKKNKMLNKVFQALVAVLIGATIWLLKIVLVKMLASSFHVTAYFDRMMESVFHHYILDTLSGPPMDVGVREEEHYVLLKGSASLPARWKDLRNAYKSKKFGSRKIDIEKLRMLTMEETASAWSVKRLMNYIKSSGLSTISKTVDEFGKAESEITSEWEARNTARRIFKNVAKAGAKYIEEEDLARFLKPVEIHTIFPLFEGALETGRITKSSFRNWVVRAYFERKSLAYSLNDTKTAVQQLHKLASAIVIVIIIVVSLLVMGLATTKVIAVVLTQLVLLGFMFQNMCKTIFESIIFVFVMHPFDIGDRCVIDGVQMIVEEMNILTTVFLRYDMEKIYYPNAVLLTKPISNFYRSPEMCDAIDFSIDASTPMETIIAFKKAIQSYIESKPNYWNPKHAVIVKEIIEVHKMRMCLAVQHTVNHQNYGERNNRISELILDMKRIFESLGISYHLLPQEIHLTQFSINNFPVNIPSSCTHPNL